MAEPLAGERAEVMAVQPDDLLAVGDGRRVVCVARKRAVARLFQPSANVGSASTTRLNAVTAPSQSCASMARSPSAKQGVDGRVAGPAPDLPEVASASATSSGSSAWSSAATAGVTRASASWARREASPAARRVPRRSRSRASSGVYCRRVAARRAPSVLRGARAWSGPPEDAAGPLGAKGVMTIPHDLRGSPSLTTPGCAPRANRVGCGRRSSAPRHGPEGRGEVTRHGRTLESRELEERGDLRRGVEVALGVLDRSGLEKLAHHVSRRDRDPG